MNSVLVDPLMDGVFAVVVEQQQQQLPPYVVALHSRDSLITLQCYLLSRLGMLATDRMQQQRAYGTLAVVVPLLVVVQRVVLDVVLVVVGFLVYE